MSTRKLLDGNATPDAINLPTQIIRESRNAEFFAAAYG